MDGAARHPDDVVLARLDDEAARQLPGELAGQDDPPLVEVGVPVRAIAAARTIGDQRDELALVLDDPARPRWRAHLGDEVGHAGTKRVGPVGAGGARGCRARREMRNGDGRYRHALTSRVDLDGAET